VYGNIDYRAEVREKIAYILRGISIHVGGGANELNTFIDGVSTIICERSVISCL
jgi:hypothetical protein